MITQTEPQTTREELQIRGKDLVTIVNKLIHEGYVCRIIIKQGEHIIMELPLTVGVVGVLLAPTLAAVGALGALLTNCTIEVVRVEPPADAYIP